MVTPSSFLLKLTEVLTWQTQSALLLVFFFFLFLLLLLLPFLSLFPIFPFSSSSSFSSSPSSTSPPSSGSGASASSGFRIRIPTGVSIAQPPPKFYAKVEQNYGVNPNLTCNSIPKASYSYGGGASGSGIASSRVLRGSDEIGKKRERDPTEEMVCAIKVLGDGFVRMEQMKMEMAREIETMRMNMEMKCTEMILDSQQRIEEAFAKAFSEKKKKPKGVASPQS